MQREISEDFLYFFWIRAMWEKFKGIIKWCFAAKAAVIWFATLLQSCVLSLNAGDLIVKTLGHHFLFISPSFCLCPTIPLTSENNFQLLWYLPIYYDHLHTCALPIISKPNQTTGPRKKSIKEYRNSLVLCPGLVQYILYTQQSAYSYIAI